MRLNTALTPRLLARRVFFVPLMLATVAQLTAGCESRSTPDSSFEVAARGVEVGAISPDARLAIIGSLHHGGSLWRTSDAERLYNWNHREGEQSTLSAAAFSPDGNWAATASADTLVLWNPTNGAAERFWSTPGDVRALALNAGAARALAGLANSKAVVFNALSGGRVAQLNHGGAVISVALSSDGRYALTGSVDQHARWWDIENARVIHRIEHRDEVQTVTLSPDHTLALSVSKYDKARLWQVDSGQVIGELALNAEHLKRGLSITAATISEDNSLLITGRQDGIVQLWHLPELTPIEQWQLPKRDEWQPRTPRVTAVAFAERGEYLAIASNGYIHRLKTTGHDVPHP